MNKPLRMTIGCSRRFEIPAFKQGEAKNTLPSKPWLKCAIKIYLTAYIQISLKKSKPPQKKLLWGRKKCVWISNVAGSNCILYSGLYYDPWNMLDILERFFKKHDNFLLDTTWWHFLQWLRWLTRPSSYKWIHCRGLPIWP